MRRLWVCLLVLLCMVGASAKEAVPMAEDLAVEQRLMAISENVRCLVCQNESLAGSRAGLADDLRREIRSQIKQGKTDAEITEFLVSRYGDFVMYLPPVKPLTWLLWFGPFALLVLAVLFLLRYLRRRPVQEPSPLTEAERRRAQSLIDDAEARS